MSNRTLFRITTTILEEERIIRISSKQLAINTVHKLWTVVPLPSTNTQITTTITAALRF